MYLNPNVDFSSESNTHQYKKNKWGNNFGWTNLVKKIWTNFCKGNKLWKNWHEWGTNFGKDEQTLAEIWSKMAEILREGTNFGIEDKLWHRGQTLAQRTNFYTKYIVIEGTNFGKNKIKNCWNIAKGNKLWQN